MSDTHRFRNPFEHWVSGLLSEILAYSAFCIAVAVLLTVVVLVKRAF